MAFFLGGVAKGWEQFRKDVWVLYASSPGCLISAAASMEDGNVVQMSLGSGPNLISYVKFRNGSLQYRGPPLSRYETSNFFVTQYVMALSSRNDASLVVDAADIKRKGKALGARVSRCCLCQWCHFLLLLFALDVRRLPPRTSTSLALYEATSRSIQREKPFTLVDTTNRVRGSSVCISTAHLRIFQFP